MSGDTAGAAGYTSAQPKVYESHTSVLVQPAGSDTNVVGGRTRGDINLDTEAQLVRSTAVAAGADWIQLDEPALAHDLDPPLENVADSRLAGLDAVIACPIDDCSTSGATTRTSPKWVATLARAAMPGL